MALRRNALLFIIIMVCAFLVSPIAAQEGGQFCVRAFEDRNGNGQRDAGEPLLTRGLGASLMNARGVIIQTALIDNSPTSAQGMICFVNLPFGQYSMNVTSADYNPTTMDNMTVTITSDPQTRTTLFEFGAQRIDVFAPPEGGAAGEVDTTAALERILVSTAGALVAMVIMAVVGLFFYLIFLRGRAPRPVHTGNPDAYFMRPDRTSTGQMRAVPPETPSETDEYTQWQ